jgi:hypothetical protein
MSLTGKNTLSLRKKDVNEQRSIAVGFKKLVFAHKASLGATGIDLGSLTTPTEMSSLGFVNASTADMLAANLMFYKKNLTLTSSSRNLLMQDLSYTIKSNSRIEFQGFTALEGEIFIGVIDASARTGNNIVDARPIGVTGTLGIGVTDFNVGQPFRVNHNPNTQIGEVIVFRNGVQQFRNVGNTVSGEGNYYEVLAGNGLGVIVRFNNAPSGEADSIMVISNGLIAERPDGSMMATIENLAGQLDQVIPTVAALAGQPETNFQAAPNNVDLKAFGDRVLELENKEVPIVTEWQTYTLIIGATTTAPTVAAPVINSAKYRRVGDSMEISYQLYSATPAGTAGTGTYLFPIPSGHTINSSKVGIGVDYNTASVVGPAGGYSSVGGPQDGTVWAYNSTNLAIALGDADSTKSAIGSVYLPLSVVETTYMFLAKVPITGWAATAKLKDI